MKVIIVGAGIAGLSTCLFLKKYCKPIAELNITIYESHKPGTKRSLAEATFQELSSSSLIVGGGLGVQPNGMRIIRELGKELYDEVKGHGFTVKKYVFKSSRGWRLNASPAGDLCGTKGYPPAKRCLL
jgi:2-polyprenyl-6-methoxyphenol hydroxylase-like FAD-dependent oxidoreductase